MSKELGITRNRLFLLFPVLDCTSFIGSTDASTVFRCPTFLGKYTEQLLMLIRPLSTFSRVLSVFCDVVPFTLVHIQKHLLDTVHVPFVDLTDNLEREVVDAVLLKVGL